MAKIYDAPEPAPNIMLVSGGREGWEEYERQCETYIERMQAVARERIPNDPLVGERVRFQYADGYAQYIVWSTKPLALVHLDVGDGWDLPAAYSRGLRLADVKARIDFERKWRKSA